MEPARPSMTLQEEAPHAMTGQARQVVLATAQRETEQFQQALAAAGEVAAQAKQALAVQAEGVQAHIDRAAIGPEQAIALEVNAAALAVAGRVAAKQDGQGAIHQPAP